MAKASTRARLRVQAGLQLDPGTAGSTDYLSLERDWTNGDTATPELPMRVTALRADPRIRADRGRAALIRGPLVCCMESADNAAPLDTIRLDGDPDRAETTTVPALGGAVALRIPVHVESHYDWGDALYRPDPPSTETTLGTFVP